MSNLALNPKKTSFFAFIDEYNQEIQVALIDQDDPEADDIRDIDHSEFDIFFGNASECLFIPWSQKDLDRYQGEGKHKALTTIEDCRIFLLSIGMTETK